MSAEKLKQSEMKEDKQQSNTELLGLSNLNSNSETQREFEYVKNTPYNLVRFGKKERWRIAIGNNIASGKTFKKKWMAKCYILSKPTSLIVTTAVIISKLN